MRDWPQEAIVERNTEKAIDALMINPLVNSYSLAVKLLGEYLETIRSIQEDGHYE